MHRERPVILVAGVPRDSFEEFAPVLDRDKLTVVQVTSYEDAVMYARAARVELVVLGVEPTTMSLEDAIRTIRSESSASKKASLLILAEPGTEDLARGFIDHGVNRVMLTVDPPKFIALQVAELLEIPPRATLRLGTRMLVEVEDGFEMALGAVVNVSAAGLLLETEADLEPGQHVWSSRSKSIPRWSQWRPRPRSCARPTRSARASRASGPVFCRSRETARNGSKPSSAMRFAFRSTRSGRPRSTPPSRRRPREAMIPNCRDSVARL